MAFLDINSAMSKFFNSAQNGVDPIYDHANATLVVATSTSQTLITPAANIKWVRIGTDADIFIRTDGVAATTGAVGPLKILANTAEYVPVQAGVAVTVITVSSANVRATPLKDR